MRRYYVAPRFLWDFLNLKRNLRTNPARLVYLQNRNLRRLIKYAYNNVPFYHKLFNENNIKPNDIQTIDDLKKIPFVTRADIQKNLNSLLSTKVNVADCVEKKTSGSSGVPLMLLEDHHASNFKGAVSLRQFFECGGRLRDKQVQLRERGASSVPKNLSKPFYESLGLFRTKWIETNEIFDNILPFLGSYKPDIVVGYPNFLQFLAENSKEDIHFRIIFTTGEVLTHHCRHLLESTFTSKVIDSYGCTEVGDIAWECPDTSSGYHINADSVITEFIKDGENVASGEEGEIVLTCLFNYAMPFIRYKIGDTGVPDDEKCTCGRTLPLLHAIEGRSDDFIVLPDGRKLPPFGIVNMQDFVGIGVTKMMIIQENTRLIQVLLKATGHVDMDILKEGIASLQSIVGPEVTVEPHFVEAFPQFSSGKIRRVFSKVARSSA